MGPGPLRVRRAVIDPSRLHVITSLSNPVRFRSRWALWELFQARMRQAGVRFTTVELTYGHHDAVCRHGYGDHVHVVTEGSNILWHKENLLNIGARYSDAEFFAFVDADVYFTAPDWAEQTLDQLQVTPVAQMFETALDLGPNRQFVGEVKHGFISSWREGRRHRNERYDDADWHPGFAWAMTRGAFRAFGSLLDVAILGAADRHMCMGYVGLARNSLVPGYSRDYVAAVMGWQERAEAHLHRNVGFVPLTLLHEFHGRKQLRYYWDRPKILIKFQYSPASDIRHDLHNNNLIEWSHHSSRRMQGLRDAVRAYFSSRMEDSVDLG